VKRREINIFSLSFLDAICCGFGAIIILFVLSKGGETIAVEQLREDGSGLLGKLEQELQELRGDTTVANRKLTSVKDQLSEYKKLLARLRGDLSSIEGEFAAAAENAEVQNELEGQLAEAKQKLTAEMRKLIRNVPKRVDNPIGGIPVDSEYIVFLIDTSGSMQTYCWPLVVKKLDEILEIYPSVKGIQVMNDMGTYMFTQYAGRWIPDTPARRKAILSTLRTWRAFSNSSPVEGLTSAINTFYDPNKRISIYVLGDEFSGVSMDPVLATIDRINRKDDSGARRVRIHAVGFPVLLQDELKSVAGATGDRFATLMREVCERNGGAFVGLNTIVP
jgi:hypothetical protein